MRLKKGLSGGATPIIRYLRYRRYRHSSTRLAFAENDEAHGTKANVKRDLRESIFEL